MNPIAKSLLLTVCTLIVSTLIIAQPKGDKIIIGESFSIKSEKLGEDRPYLVYLPEGYQPDGNPVAVMYLLDGDGHFHHTTGMVSFLIAQNRIPPMMVVAIPNTTDRTRDLTPAIVKDEDAKKNFPTGGKADNMLAFLTDELIPHIDKTYHTNSYKILVGHSFGGIFVVNALMKKPAEFDAYISISPSMWWDKQSLVDQAEEFLNGNPKLEGYFYMTMGDEGKDMLGGAMKLAALFEEKAPESFGWDFKVIKEENHGTIPHRSTYYGLEAIFKDWYRVSLNELYVKGGMSEVREHYAMISKRLGHDMRPSETDLNNLGYGLMRGGKMDIALDVFKENVKQYPKSYNVYDSMAEVYMKMGKKDEAIKHYKTSLELHPGNTNAVAMLKQMDVVVDPMSKTVKLSDKQLNKYVGKYKTPWGAMAVTADEGKLFLEMEPQVKKEALLAFENDRFLLKSQNVSILFTRNDKKEITAIEAQMGIGQNIMAEKVE